MALAAALHHNPCGLKSEDDDAVTGHGNLQAFQRWPRRNQVAVARLPTHPVRTNKYFVVALSGVGRGNDQQGREYAERNHRPGVGEETHDQAQGHNHRAYGKASSDSRPPPVSQRRPDPYFCRCGCSVVLVHRS